MGLQLGQKWSQSQALVCIGLTGAVPSQQMFQVLRCQPTGALQVASLPSCTDTEETGKFSRQLTGATATDCSKAPGAEPAVASLQGSGTTRGFYVNPVTVQKALASALLGTWREGQSWGAGARCTAMGRTPLSHTQHSAWGPAL